MVGSALRWASEFVVRVIVQTVAMQWIGTTPATLTQAVDLKRNLARKILQSVTMASSCA